MTDVHENQSMDHNGNDLESSVVNASRFPVILDHKTYSSANELLADETFCSKIVEAVQRHGIVLIRNAEFQEAEFLELTEKFGPCVTVPSFLAPSKVANFPEICRVANFNEGSNVVNLNYSFGSYWHHDGDFWRDQEHRIINLLNCKVVPDAGGRTGFLDTTAAYNALPEDIKAELSDLQVTVDPRNIEDFRNNKESLEGFETVSHRVVQTDTKYGTASLYVPYFEGTIGASCFTYDDLMALIDKPEFKYLHSWSAHDTLIWDNTKCMHRAMGQIEGKRLIWRTQARML